MKISVCYAEQQKQLWLHIEVDEGTTVEQAIVQSGILEKLPHVDLETNKVGIFGKPTKLDKVIEEGDRIEIYDPITVDPETVERRF